MEVKSFLKENIIEPSKSPWRAQVLITTNENHKRRMVVDYSRTINRYTQLDAYPLPLIDEMVSNIPKYRIFSTLLTIRYPSSRRKNLTRHSKLVGVYINSVGSLLGLQMESQVFKGL